jgi:branched-chain amino acid transport system permease protein
MSQTAINGLLLGSNYAMLAVGYTLVFGVVRLLTLAQGQVFMVSAAIALLAMRSLDLPLALAALVAIGVGGVAGLLTDVLCFRPTRHESRFSPAVATIGLGLAIEQALIIGRGSTAPVHVPSTFHPTDVHLGSLIISTPQLVMFVLSIVLMAVLGWFIGSTRWGAALRGMSEDPDTLEVLGINTRAIATAVLTLSGMLAGVAGLLVATRDGQIDPFGGTLVGLKGLAIMAVGGLGSFAGAVVVGIGVGLAEAFASYHGLGTMSSIIPWILVVPVLLVRPRGLFGGTRS